MCIISEGEANYRCNLSLISRISTHTHTHTSLHPSDRGADTHEPEGLQHSSNGSCKFYCSDVLSSAVSTSVTNTELLMTFTVVLMFWFCSWTVLLTLAVELQMLFYTRRSEKRTNFVFSSLLRHSLHSSSDFTFRIRSRKLYCGRYDCTDTETETRTI